MILEQINQPGDIKKISPSDYENLAKEIRRFLVGKISKTGGHLASNLGVVELTMALHLAFDPEKDHIIWDVGHQAYTHKLLTGRRTGFDELRRFGGMSGFPKRKESLCDPFDTGHSSTSISAGLGLAMARDLAGEDHAVISVIGDGALTGGMALEALNNVANFKGSYIIILNDNGMSISRNTGGISDHLGKIRRSSSYNNFKVRINDRLDQIPKVGQNIHGLLTHTKEMVKRIFMPDLLFENMGVTCWGPVDGHDVAELCAVFENAKKLKHPVLIHVLTKKGMGYRPAEIHPEKFHGVSAFDIKTGEVKKKSDSLSYTEIFSEKICQAAKENEKLVAITAAMPDGTGLSDFARLYPGRFVDTGIAEQHALTFAAGMAAGGMKPVVAVYSSFLQRAFDQVIHDVCIQNLPVTICVDRAGIVGADGETHQGIFDLSFLSQIPNMTVCAPKNGEELKSMLDFAFSYPYPIAIRYPRGNAYEGLFSYQAPIELGKAEWIHKEKDIALLAVGSMVETAETIYQGLKARGLNASLVNMRFVAPMDTACLKEAAKEHTLFVTLEENVKKGGFGEHVDSFVMAEREDVEVLNIAIPDVYVEHGNVDLLKEEIGLDAASVMASIVERLGDML